MCGLSGFSTKDDIKDKFNILKNMNDKLSHRGPDGEGYYHHEDVSFSHKRLAVIDLNSRSDQPFQDANKNYSITFNGEIYNYLEIKDLLIQDGHKFITTGDTEVLLYAYIKWGVKVLDKIKGMFAFAIHDKIKKNIFCARDHFGQKPFFYYVKDGNFIFSSELTSLIENPIIKREICIKSIANYLHYDSFVGESTPLKNCFKLLPSEYLIFSIENRSIYKNNYWKININKKKESKINFYESFVEKLTYSTKQHLRSDVPIALYLSGGVDSSTLACISKKVLKHQNITAFNLKFKNKTFNENILAEDTSKKIDLKLKTFEFEESNFISELSNNIKNLDEPLADLGYIAVSLISRFVSNDGYKVVISGDGGDELLMGYEPFQKLWLYNFISKVPLLSSSIKYISSLLPDSYEYMGTTHKIKVFSKGLKSPKVHANSRWICSYLPEEINSFVNDKEISSNKHLTNKFIYSYIENIINSIKSDDDYDQLTIQYQKHFLSNLICNHTDKANMQYSIEARSPFLDHELFDLANSFPRDVKLKNGISKPILRNFLKKNLNNKAFNAPKKGFTVPMAQWIKKEIKELILDILSKDTINKIGFINYNYLHEKVIYPHLKGESNNYKKIWSIFVLISWLKNNKLV